MSLLIWLLACSSTSAPGTCTSETEILVPSSVPLTCKEGKIPTRYLRILAGKPLRKGTTAAALDVVADRYRADPAATRIWLDELRDRGRAIELASGVEGAEKRASELWHFLEDASPIHRSDTVLWNLGESQMSVWVKDDSERLALTEDDIEGWLKFASLGHEIHGQGVLTVSIANKAAIYEMARQRFEQGDRPEKVALASFGVVWPEVRRAWRAAPFSGQQKVIGRLALPARSPSSSLAWVESVIEGDIVTNAHVIHSQLGPFHFRDGAGYFAESPP